MSAEVEELPGEPSELGEGWRRFSERPGVVEHVRSRWGVEDEDDDDEVERDPVGLQVLLDEPDDGPAGSLGWSYLVLDGPAMGLTGEGFDTPEEARDAADEAIAAEVARSRRRGGRAT